MLLSEVADAGLRAVGAAWLDGGDGIVEPIASDGFSGATVVRLRRAASGDLVLKSFPAAERPRVDWVHGLMRHLRRAGCGEVPEVACARTGASLVDDRQGRIWEAVRFVSGTANETPSSAQAAAAVTAVARLHLAAATWPAAPPGLGVPAAVTRRIEQARRLLTQPWATLEPPGPVTTAGSEAFAERLTRAVAISREADLEAVVRAVAATRGVAMPVHAVLRDLWWSHVLYADDEPDRAAGIVDLHAASIDTPATDLARLLGSWRRSPATSFAAAWEEVLDAYESLRPLDTERRLAPWLDATATILGLDNWFRWTLVEGRRFVRSGRAVERIDRLLERLPEAAAWLHAHPFEV